MKQLPGKKKDVLFSLASRRIAGGYEAQARIQTKTGYITVSASARQEDFDDADEGAVRGRGTLSQSAAVKEVIGQAAEIVSSSYGNNVREPAKFAILSVQAARELTERAREGDSDAVGALRYMAQSPSKSMRKAVHAQRLFGDR